MALHVLMRAGAPAGSEIPVPRGRRPESRPTAFPDELFASIDGRDLSMGGKRWHVEVFSVREIGGRRYVQLALRGGPDYFLTLRTHLSTDVRRVVPGLLMWLMHPAVNGPILDLE